MATFDQLSAEQRAIIELVLKQGQSYDQLGDMLGLPTSRVRELAREALVRLSPVSAAAVEDDWRGQLGDYLLNQQTGPEATATRGHLRRSEAARGWASSVLDSLEQFYDEKSLPTIPDGEAAAEPRPPRQRREKREKRERAREARGARASRAARALARRARCRPPAAAPGPRRGRAGAASCCSRARLAHRAARLATTTTAVERPATPRRPRTNRRAWSASCRCAPVESLEGDEHRPGHRRDRRARRGAPADRAGPPAQQRPQRGLPGVALQLRRGRRARSAPRWPTSRATSRVPGPFPRTSRTTSSSTSRESRSGAPRPLRRLGAARARSPISPPSRSGTGAEDGQGEPPRTPAAED